MSPFGFGEKKERGRGFSVLAAREMKQDPKNESGGGGREGRKLSSPPPPRSFTFPRSLLLNQTETLATQAIDRLDRHLDRSVRTNRLCVVTLAMIADYDPSAPRFQFYPNGCYCRGRPNGPKYHSSSRSSEHILRRLARQRQS